MRKYGAVSVATPTDAELSSCDFIENTAVKPFYSKCARARALVCRCFVGATRCLFASYSCLLAVHCPSVLRKRNSMTTASPPSRRPQTAQHAQLTLATHLTLRRTAWLMRHTAPYTDPDTSVTRCAFLETFTQTRMYIVNDENMVMPDADATYYLGVHVTKLTTGKVTVVVADLAETEDFASPYTTLFGESSSHRRRTHAVMLSRTLSRTSRVARLQRPTWRNLFTSRSRTFRSANDQLHLCIARPFVNVVLRFNDHRPYVLVRTPAGPVTREQFNDPATPKPTCCNGSRKCKKPLRLFGKKKGF